MQWNRQLLESGRIEQMSGAMRQSNQTAQAAVDDPMIERMRKTLPSFDRLGASLKYGKFSVVSTQGPEVVNLIHTVPIRKGKDRNDALTKLVEYSRQGVPEAQTFSGFVYEYGLFGAPRNLKLAREYYTAAAARLYQPAVFNLANMAYLGKGQAMDMDAARELIHQAAGLGVEASGRVCGLASFIEYRRGNIEAALQLAKFCYSPLANIPNAAYGNQLPLTQRVKMLRDSIGTGVPDAYRWLEEITQRAGPDPNYLYCKYRLVNQLRARAGKADIKTLAKTCHANSTYVANPNSAAGAIDGIAAFAVTEQRLLEQLRQANRFHHFWSVPYLPFGQADVDLYEPVMKEAQ
jgi:TPR repeat protein